ncbi:MAG: esterase family protein, partial [Myxococcaceae bacterium]|nr:esterase family protein [Myxococcaceae bacterium]
PRHYDDDPSRRFPVVLVFPGFSGLAAQNDGFGARGLFDSLGDATGVEVILVGVETRVAEGTRYLVPDGTGGDWIGYVTKRVLPWLDERFRTQPLRAAYGHSTGGWNALSLALAAPDVVEVAAASSPDPLDLDVWFLDGAAPRPRWWWWQRAEERLGGRGQFHSWATSWSAQGALPFDAGGALRPAVYGAWVRQSLATRVSTASLRLSGRLFLTAGTNDMFDLYAPTERFVELARARGLDVTWHPTALDHFGATEARFTPLVRFLLEKLKTARR